MESAAALVPQGRWREAAEALESAAELHARQGRAYDQSRCLQLAATLCRSAGEVNRAQPLAERAAALRPAPSPLSVSISAEQAETAFAQDRYAEAITAWTSALEEARRSGLKAEGISALLRRRAAAYLALGQAPLAINDFDQAYGLLVGTLGKARASFVRTEEAGLFLENGDSEHAEQVAAALEADLGSASPEPQLIAEMRVLRARLARTAGRMEVAAQHARQARDAALEAVAPLSFLSASVELAEALQSRGDLAGAYGTLAGAWVTLADLLGNDTARTWIEPCLLLYQLRWGEPLFRKAKCDYEARRRAEMKNLDPT